MGRYLGIDIGGTFVKCAEVDETGEILDRWKVATDVSDNGSSIPGDIVSSVREHAPEVGFDGVGAGVPGAVSTDGERVERAVNLGWSDMPLKADLESGLGAPVVLLNDANAAALGEMWQGAARGSKDLLFVTLGTGVGGGVVLDGDLRVGAHSAAGELGHIPVRSDEHRTCGCGNENCLETFASANGFVRTMARILDERGEDRGTFSTVDIMRWVSEGDEAAEEALGETVEILGSALAGVVNTLDIDQVVVGGGLSEAGDAFLVPLAKAMDAHLFPQVRGNCSLKRAELGNDAGIFGAVYAAIGA